MASSREDLYPLLKTLKRLGLPETRENYLAVDGWDNPNPEMTQEDEQLLPPEMRQHPK